MHRSPPVRGFAAMFTERPTHCVSPSRRHVLTSFFLSHLFVLAAGELRVCGHLVTWHIPPLTHLPTFPVPLSHL